MKPTRFDCVLKLTAITLAVGSCFILEAPNAHAQDTSAMQHEPLIVVGNRIFMAAGDDVTEVEEISQYCLGCHDGAIAQARQTLELRSSSRAGCTGLAGAHPIGTRYPAGSLKFSDPATLPSSMFMSNGCLTCVTCHNLEREDHGLLVSNRRSALCLTCHRK